MKRKILKTVHFICDFVFALFIVSFAYIFFTVYRGNIPNIMGYHILKVVSSSMEPVFYEGDCIIAETVDVDDIEVGDIITFFSDDPMILNFLNTHRVKAIQVNDDGRKEYWTKGDNNDQEDAFTAKEDRIVGRYAGDLLFGRILTIGFELLSNRIVYFILIVFPILVSFVSSIVSMVRLIIDEDYGSADSRMYTKGFDEDERK